MHDTTENFEAFSPNDTIERREPEDESPSVGQSGLAPGQVLVIEFDPTEG